MKPILSRLSRCAALWGLIMALMACSPINQTNSPLSPSEGSPKGSAATSTDPESTQDQDTSTPEGATRPSKGSNHPSGSTTPSKSSKSATGPSAAPVEGVVVKVVDGDTVHVLLDSEERVKVRVLGIDTPEIAHNSKERTECFGTKATKQMRKRVDQKRVRLVPDERSMGTDHYERLLRYVEVDGVDVGKELIEQGLAHAYVPKSAKKPVRFESYRKAEARAKAQKRGGWSDCGW